MKKKLTKIISTILCLCMLTNIVAFAGAPNNSGTTVKGTTQGVLNAGIDKDSSFKMCSFGNGKIIIVYTADVPGRTNINAKGVYYRIYNGTSWGSPVLLQDDGTLDYCPNIDELNNGQLLITWSSADKVFPDGTSEFDVKTALDIYAVFFDTTTESLGNVDRITHTTNGDYTADLNAHGVYDAALDRIILYYTKAEYKVSDPNIDINSYDPFTVIAYLYCDSGYWRNTRDEYTDEELMQPNIPDMEQYRTDWYGQRFIDIRTSNNNPCRHIIDYDVAYYNGFAFFTYIGNNDYSLATDNNRDVFVQIYNFASNSFTHNIRITPTSGLYCSLKLLRSGSNLYIFYGEKDTNSQTNNKLMCLGINNDLLQNKLVNVKEGDDSYYVFKDINTGKILPSKITNCTNVDNYGVAFSSGSGAPICAVWEENINNKNVLLASKLLDKNENNLKDWSNAVQIDFCDNQSKSYSDMTVVSPSSGEIYIACNQNKSDPANSDIALIKHVIQSDIVISNAKFLNDYPRPGSTSTVQATLSNNGLLDFSGQLDVTFNVNGTDYKTSNNYLIAGGDSASINQDVTIPSDVTNLTVKVTVNGTTIEAPAVVGNNIVVNQASYSDENNAFKLTTDLSNSGNMPANNIKIEAYIGSEVIGSYNLDTLGYDQSKQVAFDINVKDSLLNIVGNVGTADLRVVASVDGVEKNSKIIQLTKNFNNDAITLMSQITKVEFANNGQYELNVNQSNNIQPTITGVEANKAKVKWLSSSGDGLTIDNSNNLVATKEGTFTATGLVVPNVDMPPTSTGEAYNWEAYIPENIQKKVTITVNASYPLPSYTEPVTQELKYNGATQNLLQTNPSSTDGTVYYSFAENGTYTTTPPTGIEAKKYDIWWYVKGDENHLDSQKFKTSVEITNNWQPIKDTEYTVSTNDWTNADVTIAAKDGYLISTQNLAGTADDWKNELVVSTEDTTTTDFYVKNTATGEISLVARETTNIDTVKPTGKITVGLNSWQEFVNTITFGLFYKDTQSVKIEANDALSGVKSIEYYKSATSMTLDEIKANKTWTTYSDLFQVAAVDGEQFVIYAMITDNAGNVFYLSSDGNEFDQTAPEITGVTDNVTYLTTQKIKVTDKNLDSVNLVNNTSHLIKTLTVADGKCEFLIDGNSVAEYTIKTKDKAGNEAVINVNTNTLDFAQKDFVDITVDNVKSTDKDDITLNKQALEELRKLANNTPEENEKLDEMIAKDQAMLDKLTEIDTKATDESVKATDNKTPENVKLEDKQNLIDAKKIIEDVLANNADNLTADEKAELETKLKNINNMISYIETVENVNKQITDIPTDIKADDVKTVDAIRKAKADYDKLDEYQKSLVEKKDLKKLNDAIDAIDYKVVEISNDAKFTKSVDKDLVITVNAAAEKFVALLIDGEEVDKANYTVESGSTIITVKAEYLNTLSEGEHNFTVKYTDDECDGKFTVNPEPVVETDEKSPATGSNYALTFGVVLMIGLSLSLMTITSRKKRTNK